MLDSVQVHKALELTCRLHKGKTRKTGAPAVAHPFRVILILSNYAGDDEKIYVAGLLHSALENRRYTYRRLVNDFGHKIAALVKEVNSSISPREEIFLSLPNRFFSGVGLKANWLTRQSQVLETFSGKSDSAKLIITANKIDNLQSLIEDHAKYGDKLWRKLGIPKEHLRQHYDQFFNLLVVSFNHPILSLYYEVQERAQNIWGKEELRKT